MRRNIHCMFHIMTLTSKLCQKMAWHVKMRPDQRFFVQKSYNLVVHSFFDPFFAIFRVWILDCQFLVKKHQKNGCFFSRKDHFVGDDSLGQKMTQNSVILTPEKGGLFRTPQKHGSGPLAQTLHRPISTPPTIYAVQVDVFC